MATNMALKRARKAQRRKQVVRRIAQLQQRLGDDGFGFEIAA
jgi:hypothetical protein